MNRYTAIQSNERRTVLEDDADIAASTGRRHQQPLHSSGAEDIVASELLDEDDEVNDEHGPYKTGESHLSSGLWQQPTGILTINAQ